MRVFCAFVLVVGLAVPAQAKAAPCLFLSGSSSLNALSIYSASLGVKGFTFEK
jgi:hypothetical protein